MPMATGWRGPSAINFNSVCIAGYDSVVGNGGYNDSRIGVRPVVSIPKSASVMTALGLN